MRYPVESSTDMVFQAVVSLREADQVATRETVADITALKLSVVDDRLRALVLDGRLQRLIRGVYEVAPGYAAPRTIFCGILHDGCVKLEIGDEVLTLTPNEARRVARALGGFLDDARVIEKRI